MNMAKTYNNLYPEIYSFENLHAAYLRARRGKRDRIEVQRFELDLEGNLIQLQNELKHLLKRFVHQTFLRYFLLQSLA